MGHEPSLPYGSSATLNCTTDLAVDTIVWLDMKENVLANGNDSLLELTVIPMDINNLAYTCRVTSMFGVQNQTITLSILSEAIETSPVMLSVIIPTIIAFVMLAVLLTAVIAVIVIVR